MLPTRLLALALCASLAALALADAPARKDMLGDPLPEGAISRMGSGRLRASTGITCLAFTPDGKSLVSAGYGNKLTFWSVSTGQVEKEWTLAVSNVNGMHFDKAGKIIAVTSNDGTARILDAKTGEERRQLADPNNRYSQCTVSLSPDGKWLVMNHRYDSQIVLFNVDTGALAHRIAGVNSYNRPPIVFTPDSKHFVSLWKDNRLHLVSCATGESVRGLEVNTTSATNYSTRITGMALSPDGKKLFYRSYSDRHFYVVEVATGREVGKFERITGYNYASSGNLHMTPNGRFVVESSGDAAIRVWGIASGKMLRELTVPNASLGFSTTSPDGKLVAAAANTSIFLWDIATGKQLHGGAGHANAVTRLAFSPDGKQLVSTGASSMRVWDAATGTEQAMTRSNVNGSYASYLAVALDARSVRWIGYDRAKYQWNFGTEREPVKLTTPKVVNGNFNAIATSPDGKHFAVFNAADGTMKLLDNVGNAPDRELGRLPPNHGVTFQFSPDSRTLAVAASDRSVTLFDVATGHETRKLMPDPSKVDNSGTLVEFSPDGRTLLLFDGETRVVETITGSDRAFLSRETAGRPSGVGWSDDGRIVARGFSDGLAVVTDLWTGRELFRRETGQGTVYSLAVSRDNKRLATGGANTTAVVWELAALERPARVASMRHDTAWADLEEGDASRAYRAMLHLIASPDETARLFAKQLEPHAPVEAARIDRLIADLNDDDYKVREKATGELLEIGLLARDALKKAARSTSLEVKRRATDLLRRLEPGTGIAPERLRSQRAVEVLERIGTPAARIVLETMLKGKVDASLEASIRDSLARGK